MNLKLFVDIYRSSKKEGMYLYVIKDANLDELPELLQKEFSKRELAMSIELTPEKKLATADARKVMASIEEQGYYLQMPPRAELYMQAIPNDKLPRKL